MPRQRCCRLTVLVTGQGHAGPPALWGRLAALAMRRANSKQAVNWATAGYLGQALWEHRGVQQTDDIDGCGGGAQVSQALGSASPLEHDRRGASLGRSKHTGKGLFASFPG